MSDAMAVQQQAILGPSPSAGFSVPANLTAPFSPPYTFTSLNAEAYDPMFGLQTNMMASSIPGAVHGINNAGTTSTSGNVNGSYQGYGIEQQASTPGGRSNGESTGESEKDPFLSLLEQLAENEHSRGGPSELDFFLSGANG